MNLAEYNEQHKYWKVDNDLVWGEIHFGRLTDELCELGWTKVILSPMTQERSNKIDQWIDAECTDQTKTMGLVWLFKDAKDAIMFTLVWA